MVERFLRWSLKSCFSGKLNREFLPKTVIEAKKLLQPLCSAKLLFVNHFRSCESFAGIGLRPRGREPIHQFGHAPGPGKR